MDRMTFVTMAKEISRNVRAPRLSEVEVFLIRWIEVVGAYSDAFNAMEIKSGTNLDLGSANERVCYNATSSLIDGAHTRDDSYRMYYNINTLGLQRSGRYFQTTFQDTFS